MNELNSQIFLNFNQSDLVLLHFSISIRLCLRVIEMNGLMNQICLNYDPYYLVKVLLKVIVMMIKRRFAVNPTITGTH